MAITKVEKKIIEQISKLEEKYQSMGQDLSSYLDGLLHSDFLTYWDYIHLDTLLSLQNPKTQFKDEMIFITYHQHTELFFKLILWEMKQIISKQDIDHLYLLNKMKRINGYFQVLEHSFFVMGEGMDKEEFLKFRMSLLPASGFQSIQYRMIEIYSTDVFNLVDQKKRKSIKDTSSLENLVEHFYWKSGSTQLNNKKKTLTLIQFEKKYLKKIIQKAEELRFCNLSKIIDEKFMNNPDLVSEFKKFDVLANIKWPLSHYKSTVKYLNRSDDHIKASGGTNWKSYLPPKFQKIVFFPQLWNENEINEWGKSWVFEEVFQSS